MMLGMNGNEAVAYRMGQARAESDAHTKRAIGAVLGFNRDPTAALAAQNQALIAQNQALANQNSALAAESANLRQYATEIRKRLEDYINHYNELEDWAERASQDLKHYRGEI